MKFNISIGENRFSTNWKNTSISWGDFLERISIPLKTTETREQFLSFDKAKRDNLKDIGGFVGGELKDGRRKAENVLNRSMITLDADDIEPRQNTRNFKLYRWEKLCLCCLFNKKPQFI